MKILLLITSFIPSLASAQVSAFSLLGSILLNPFLPLLIVFGVYLLIRSTKLIAKKSLKLSSFSTIEKITAFFAIFGFINKYHENNCISWIYNSDFLENTIMEMVPIIIIVLGILGVIYSLKSLVKRKAHTLLASIIFMVFGFIAIIPSLYWENCGIDGSACWDACKTQEELPGVTFQ